MRAFALALAFASLSGVRGEAQSRGDSVEIAAIRARRESSNRAIARHDTAGHGAILAPDVVLVTSASVKQVGREVQLRGFAELFGARPDVIYVRTPRAIRIFEPWRMASEDGTWEGSWTEPDGKVAIGGRYFAKWRRVEGAWYLESETFVPEHCTGSAFCARVP